jgi:hypothetical protein
LRLTEPEIKKEVIRMGGETMTLGANKVTAKGLSIEEVRKQAGITAKDIIRQLQEAIDHEEISYPRLIEILRYYLRKSMNELIIFRPDNLPFSLKALGLQKLYKVLEELDKKEEKEYRKKKSNRNKN